MIHLLCVGASEVKIFRDGRKWLSEEYGIDVFTEFRSGARIDECLPLLRRGMVPRIDIVLIWALTPLAWKRMTIYTKGRRDLTVFCPNQNTSISEIPALMNLLYREMYDQNPNCIMYMVLPAIKDFYTFNQTRIVKAWGPKYKDFLKNHPLLNASRMRQHSIKTFRLFTTLLNAEYVWIDKHVIQAEHTISHYYNKKGRHERINNKPPTAYFFSGETNILNCSLLPDGLHGTWRFLEAFMKCNRGIFYQLTGHDKYGEPVPKKGKTIHSRMLVNSQQLPPDSDDENNEVVDLQTEHHENDGRTSSSSDNVDRCLRRCVDFQEPSTSSTYEGYYPIPIVTNESQIENNQHQPETTWEDSQKYYTYTLPDYDYGKYPSKADDAGAVASTSTGITHDTLNYNSEANIAFFQANIRQLMERRSAHTDNNLEYQSWLFHDLEQAVKREKRIHNLRKQL